MLIVPLATPALVQAQAPAGAAAERIAVSFVLAQGRLPTPEERTAWADAGTRPVAELLARHRTGLAADAALRRAVADRAARDAFGRVPTAEELAAAGRAAPADATYGERVRAHLATLKDRAAEYEQVLHRAYRLVVRREAYAEELAYWARRDVVPFAFLVGCLDDWARRNQPGLMVTSGAPTVSVNCEFLVTARVSPAVAAEVRGVLGFAPLTYVEENPGARGRNLLGAGGAEIRTGGRIHFVAAGAPALVP